jgi:hypothetical protein
MDSFFIKNSLCSTVQMASPPRAFRVECPGAPVKNVSFHSPLPKPSDCPLAPKKIKRALAALRSALKIKKASMRFRRALRDASDRHTSMGGGPPLEQ